MNNAGFSDDYKRWVGPGRGASTVQILSKGRKMPRYSPQPLPFLLLRERQFILIDILILVTNFGKLTHFHCLCSNKKASLSLYS